MKLPNPFACDICKRQKQDSNKWFKGYLLGGDRILIVTWDANVDTNEDEFHLCGESCVMEWASRNLSKIN